jgi:hypothetical protein
MAPTSLATAALAIGRPSSGVIHVLGNPVGVAVASPWFGVPGKIEVTAVLPVGLTVFPPLIDRPAILAQGWRVTSLTVGSPAFTAPTLKQRQLIRFGDLVVGPPALGAPVFARVIYGIHAINIAIGSPVVGVPAMKRVVALTPTLLSTGSPAIGRPLQARANYAMTAVGATAGSPAIAVPGMTWNPVFGPFPILIGRPEIGGPTLRQRHQLLGYDLWTEPPTSSFDEVPPPDFTVFDKNPEVICLTDRDDPTSMPAIHANYNADFDLELWPGPNLVGRTDPTPGPAQIIEVDPPFSLAGQKLKLTIEVPLAVKDDGALVIDMKSPLVVNDQGQLVIDIDALLGPLNAAVFGLSSSLTGAAGSINSQLGGVARDVSELKARMLTAEQKISLNTGNIANQATEIYDVWAGATPLGIYRSVLGTTNFTVGPPAFGVPSFTPNPLTTGNITAASPVIGVPTMGLNILGAESIYLHSPVIGRPWIGTIRPPSK